MLISIPHFVPPRRFPRIDLLSEFLLAIFLYRVLPLVSPESRPSLLAVTLMTAILSLGLVEGEAYCYRWVLQRHGLSRPDLRITFFGAVREFALPPSAGNEMIFAFLTGVLRVGTVFILVGIFGLLILCQAPEAIRAVAAGLVLVKGTSLALTFLPSFPFEGGHAWRAFWAWATKEDRWATRMACYTGGLLGLGFMLLGVLSLANSNLVGGLLWGFLGGVSLKASYTIFQRWDNEAPVLPAPIPLFPPPTSPPIQLDLGHRSPGGLG
jgi:hypothetical protein